MRLAAILLSFPALHAALMPLPVLVQPTPGAFPINANFIVDTVGPANTRLAPAVKSFLARVTRQTGITYAPSSPAPADARRLTIDCAGGCNPDSYKFGNLMSQDLMLGMRWNLQPAPVAPQPISTRG